MLSALAGAPYWIVVGGLGLLGIGVLSTSLLSGAAALRRPADGLIGFLLLAALCAGCYYYEITRL
jgi:hypothetical protein